jgi:hypothetical protein
MEVEQMSNPPSRDPQTEMGEGPELANLTVTVPGNDDPNALLKWVHGPSSAAPTLAKVRFAFRLDPQDQEQLRWYLEDFLERPINPSPAIAARVEARMAEIGREMYSRLLEVGDSEGLDTRLRHALAHTRIEIVTDDNDVDALPWELIREPHASLPLALESAGFVRSSPSLPTERVPLPPASDRVRILLAISRPGGRADVPFRSVATRIVSALAPHSDRFALDVLRPPTFERLKQVVDEAKARGRPYHIVHFDGHGTFDSVRKRGYLLFEGTTSQHVLVTGSILGQALVSGHVPILVLNACRSALVEASESPGDAPAEERPRALGPLAREVLETGVRGVVAMRYNVYVVTAASFMLDLYASLATRRSLSQSVNDARQGLAHHPNRNLGGVVLTLEDWCVPVLYEAAETALPLPPAERAHDFAVQLGETTPAPPEIEAALPPPPRAGFVGRHEVLLPLDRAFVEHPVVLLRGFAGSGKTATAAEFARWYVATGGVPGPVLFTAFSGRVSSQTLLDQLLEAFESLSPGRRIAKEALDSDRRRSLAMELMRDHPVFWIWDGVEPIAGFPRESHSEYSSSEQSDIVRFLEEASSTGSRFLLTSRRDEAWLGDAIHVVPIPNMPLQERQQLAGMLAAAKGKDLDIEAWWPLLIASQGNPLTLEVLALQAFRADLRSQGQIESLLREFRTQEGDLSGLDDFAGSDRLAASLGYGFDRGFDQEEKRILALLRLFEGHVHVLSFSLMGFETAEWRLPAIEGIDPEKVDELFGRARDVGLLTRLQPGSYAIHPAVPWFFRGLFDRYYPSTSNSSEDSPARRALLAFINAMALIGQHQLIRSELYGTPGMLLREEGNLRMACQEAIGLGQWDLVMKTMQALHLLYRDQARSRWERQIDEVMKQFIDPETGLARPGLEWEWLFMMDFLAEAAEHDTDWTSTERYNAQTVAVRRDRASAILSRPHDGWDNSERDLVRSLAVGLHNLGRAQSRLGFRVAQDTLLEGIDLARALSDGKLEAQMHLDLGVAYMTVEELKSFIAAEREFGEGLRLVPTDDVLLKAKILTELGTVSYERCLTIETTKGRTREGFSLLKEAKKQYDLALELTPAEAISSLAVIHRQLGMVWAQVSVVHYVSEYRSHLEAAIVLREREGNLYKASATRLDLARLLGLAGFQSEALAFAQAALKSFDGLGAANKAAEARELLARLGQG